MDGNDEPASRGDEWRAICWFNTQYYSNRLLLLLSGILKESCTSGKKKFAVIKRFWKWFMYIPHPLMGAIYGIPGQHISDDHFICSTRGCLLTSAGKTKSDEMFTEGCIFDDHASSNLDTHKTLRAKKRFELTCQQYGVTPYEYPAENSKVFTSNEFTRNLLTFAQIMRFAGVGSHHHNGIPERNIRTIIAIARTMMLNAAIYWPSIADATLWPLAINHAVFLVNHVPDRRTGLCPRWHLHQASKTRWEAKAQQSLHLGLPYLCVGQDDFRWQEVATMDSKINTHNQHGFLFKARYHCSNCAQPTKWVSCCLWWLVCNCSIPRWSSRLQCGLLATNLQWLYLPVHSRRQKSSAVDCRDWKLCKRTRDNVATTTNCIRHWQCNATDDISSWSTSNKDSYGFDSMTTTSNRTISSHSL